MNKGLLIVVSGPSGVGKGTVLKEVFDSDSNLVYSVSSTTRTPRPGEVDGVHYNFLSIDQFEQKIKQNKMLEYATYCDNYYGTSAEYVENQRNCGKDVVLEIDTQGARQVSERCDDAVTIFIAPPSFEQLEKRLVGRGTEDKDVIDKRIQTARNELLHAKEYQYVVINDALEDAIDDVKAILKAERLKVNKNNL